MSLHTNGHALTAQSGGYSPLGRAECADWSSYAAAYDLLSLYNPEYRALLQDFEAFLATIETPRVIYDVGGGTGNYTQIVARACPHSEIHLVDPAPAMIQTARSKLVGHPNISFHATALEDIKMSGNADLVVCVHALYAMPDQVQRLDDLRRLLRPGGFLYLIDLGRYMNVFDWRRYLFTELTRQHGLTGALRVFWEGREVAKQNKAILKAQKCGAYWTHTEAEFAATVADAGFQILRQRSVYRGYSDLIVGRARE